MSNNNILIINQAATNNIARMLFKGKEYTYFEPIGKKNIKAVTKALILKILGLLPSNAKEYGNFIARYNCYLLEKKFSTGNFSSIVALHSISSNPYLKYAAEELSENTYGIWCSRIERYVKKKNKKQNISKKIKYLVFGERDKRFLIELGASADNVYSFGSPLTNLLLTKLYPEKESQKKYKYDICIVSQLIDDFFHDDKWTETRKKEFETAKLMMREINLLGSRVPKIKIVIALRPQSHGAKYENNEIEFYKRHLRNLDLSFSKHDGLSSYYAGLGSKVVLSAHSTLGFELIGLNSTVWFYRPFIQFENNIINSTDTDFTSALANDLHDLLNGNHWFLKKDFSELKKEFNNIQSENFQKILSIL